MLYQRTKITLKIGFTALVKLIEKTNRNLQTLRIFVRWLSITQEISKKEILEKHTSKKYEEWIYYLLQFIQIFQLLFRIY